MKTLHAITSIVPRRVSLILMLLLALAFNQAAARDFYQLKVYTIDNEAQEQRMDDFLETAYLPALHRAGIERVGVFKPVKEHDLFGSRIFVLIPLEMVGQILKLDQALKKDTIYQKAGADYIDAAHDNPPYARIESILLRSFKSMPAHGIPDHSTPASERIYELRSYQGATEKLYERKVEMFNEGGEAQIFHDLGFQPIFFGEVISGSSMPNLMYLTTFANKEAQDQHWQAFRDAPAWQALRTNPYYNNTVSKNEKFILHPTDYSDL